MSEELAREMVGEAGSSASFTLLQWNLLADSLSHGSFIKAPSGCLDWVSRRERLVAGIGTNGLPDIVCLQEVDHHEDFFGPRLIELGYEGNFVAKPGRRDGCALYCLRTRFEIDELKTLRYRDADGSPQGQLAVSQTLRPVGGGPELRVVSTHLKAKPGFEERRASQASQLLEAFSGEGPLIVAGDFNDVPGSLAYQRLVAAGMNSAYAKLAGEEPSYTTWKVRESGEVQRTIDYVWYSPEHVRPVASSSIPDPALVDEARFPNWQYPSDHLSLMVRFEPTP